jgi:alpha-L-rhamnosidase
MGQTTYPSWGYFIKELGLKTWPETWSGWGSHVILVTVTPGSWFYEGLAGIRPDPMNPGFKHFTLRPGIVPRGPIKRRRSKDRRAKDVIP